MKSLRFGREPGRTAPLAQRESCHRAETFTSHQDGCRATREPQGVLERKYRGKVFKPTFFNFYRPESPAAKSAIRGISHSLKRKKRKTSVSDNENRKVLPQTTKVAATLYSSCRLRCSPATEAHQSLYLEQACKSLGPIQLPDEHRAVFN